MDNHESNNLSEIFSDDIKSTQDKIKYLRNKYNTEDELQNSAEWQEFKETSSKLIDGIVKKGKDINIKEIECRKKIEEINAANKYHTRFTRRTPLPKTVVILVFIILAAAMYHGATT